MLFICFLEEQKSKTFTLEHYCSVLDPTLRILAILKLLVPSLFKRPKLLSTKSINLSI